MHNMEYSRKLITLIFLFLFSPVVFAGYDISDYLEHNAGITKNFGTTSQTYRVRYYGGTSYGYGEDWNLYEYTGPNGGYDNDGNWDPDSHQWLNTWHMKDYVNGDVKEIGDTLPTCTLRFYSGLSIWWGTDDMDIDEEFESQLHHYGSCGDNWGWSEVKITDHYDDYQIPAMSGNGCSAATFEDVIEIQLTQWYCDNSQCNNPAEFVDVFVLANGFGVIEQQWGSSSYFIRDINLGWIGSTQQCATTWISNH